MIRWDDTPNTIGKEQHCLFFSHHYGEEKMICCLFKGIDTKDWLYTSDILDGYFTKLFLGVDNAKISLHDAKLKIEQGLYRYYESKMKYYQEILDELNS